MTNKKEETYIIFNKSDLKGTAYIELFPDKFKNTHWNDSSIFFEEYHWEFFVGVIKRHYPAYDPYGFQTLNSDLWKKICEDLNKIAEKIENGAKVNDIRDDIQFMSQYTENEFMNGEEHNFNKLKETIHQLTKWIDDKLNNSPFISILGL